MPTELDPKVITEDLKKPELVDSTSVTVKTIGRADETFFESTYGRIMIGGWLALILIVGVALGICIYYRRRNSSREREVKPIQISETHPDIQDP